MGERRAAAVSGSPTGVGVGDSSCGTARATVEPQKSAVNVNRKPDMGKARKETK